MAQRYQLLHVHGFEMQEGQYRHDMKTELRGGNLCPRLTVLDPQLDVL